MTNTTNQQVEKRRELISKEYIRGGLVRKMVNKGLNSLSTDELQDLYALDQELGPIDMKQLFFDEITYLHQNPSPAVEKLLEALRYFASPSVYKKETINYHGFVELEEAVLTNGQTIAKNALSQYEAEVGKK